jgi:aspartyl-tRNA(Asn)/glutamyl-tRNA(Gln) amidotransferase subunit C
MSLSQGDVRAIADYTRIDLNEDEISTMTVDLNQIIEGLKPITEYDLTGVEPTFHPIAGLTNVMREDVLGESLSLEVIMTLAPAHQDGQYRIPPILGDEGGDR